MTSAQAGTTVEVMNTSAKPDQHKSQWGPPPDSDLIGIPLVLGIAVAVAAVFAAFAVTDWVGLIVLGVVLIAALAITYRVVTDSESED